MLKRFGLRTFNDLFGGCGDVVPGVGALMTACLLIVVSFFSVQWYRIGRDPSKGV